MTTNQKLVLLMEAAQKNEELKNKLLSSKTGKDPMLEFCQTSTEYDIPLTVGELFALGEETSDNQCKSTNGGNPSPYEYLSDPYEMFLAGLE